MFRLSPKVGSIAKSRFVDRAGSDMEILRLEKNRLVHWSCVAHLSGDEWVATEIFFELQPEKDCTTLHFSHRRWLEATNFFRYCSAKWAVYLVSLKNLIETGKGAPWPRDIQI
jgi:Activator of Hsp90 ATPase homolog 1-like protein